MSTCPRCHAVFHCGISDTKAAGNGSKSNEGGDTACWCMRLPPLSLPADYRAELNPDACFCPACLRDALKGTDGT